MFHSTDANRLCDEAYQHWADIKQQEDNMDDKVSWHECSHDRCSEAARLQLAWHDLKWLAECRCASVKSISLLYSAMQLLQQVWDDDDAFGKYKEDDATEEEIDYLHGDIEYLYIIRFTKDSAGAMEEKGYDGEEYSELDECIDYEY